MFTAFALLATVLSAPADPVLLKMSFTEGLSYSFIVEDEMTMTMEGMGEETESVIKSQSKLNYTFSGIQPDGTARMKLETEVLKMSSSSDGEEDEETELPEKTVYSGLISSLGKLSEWNLESEPDPEESSDFGPLEDLFGDIYPSFSPEAVIQGARWDRNIPDAEELFPKDSKQTVTFDGTVTLEGRSFYKVTLSTDLPLDTNMSKLTGEEGDAEMGDVDIKGTVKSTDVYWLNRENCHPVRVESTTKIEIVMPLIGSEFKMNLVYKSVGKREEKD